MAVAKDGRGRVRLAPLGDEDRPAPDRVVDNLAVKPEPGERRRDLVGEIGAQHRQALRDLAFGRDRDTAREIGGKPALVEIALGGGDGGGAGHEPSVRNSTSNPTV